MKLLQNLLSFHCQGYSGTLQLVKSEKNKSKIVNFNILFY